GPAAPGAAPRPPPPTERRRPLPAPTPNGHASRDDDRAEGQPPGGFADLLSEAEALPAVLHDALGRTGPPLAALTPQPRQAKAVGAARATLRQLQLGRCPGVHNSPPVTSTGGRAVNHSPWLPEPTRPLLLRHLGRLREALQGLGERNRDALARTLAAVVAGLVCEAVAGALASPGPPPGARPLAAARAPAGGAAAGHVRRARPGGAGLPSRGLGRAPAAPAGHAPGPGQPSAGRRARGTRRGPAHRGLVAGPAPGTRRA